MTFDSYISKIDLGITAPEIVVMPKADRFVGLRVGRSVVVAKVPKVDRYQRYLLQCDCGTEYLMMGQHMSKKGNYHCGDTYCRFLSKVDKNGPVVSEELGNCYLWLGAKRSNGYGSFRVTNETNGVKRAHIYSWEKVNGPKPKGLVLMHKCDTRLCVRESHLEPGTHKENMRDMVLKGRSFKGSKRLTEVRRRNLCRDANKGLTHRKLAIKYDVTERTVCRILAAR
jgi:hypothetical protein